VRRRICRAAAAGHGRAAGCSAPGAANSRAGVLASSPRQPLPATDDNGNWDIRDLRHAR